MSRQTRKFPVLLHVVVFSAEAILSFGAIVLSALWGTKLFGPENQLSLLFFAGGNTALAVALFGKISPMVYVFDLPWHYSGKEKDEAVLRYLWLGIISLALSLAWSVFQPRP